MPKKGKYGKRGGGTEGGMPNGVSQIVTQSGATPTGPAMPPSTTPPSDIPSPPDQQMGGSPAPYGPGPYSKSQYYTISGGNRRRSHGRKRSSKRSSKRNRKYKGGSAVLASAAIPFGLLALQRYFKGSKTSKKGVAKMGRSFKRTFRRRY